MAKMAMKIGERPRVKLECLRLLATLKLDKAKMQLISGFVDIYLKLNKEEEKIFHQEIKVIRKEEQKEIMEIVTSWMEQGLQQGRREGRQEGRQEGELALILRQLNRRIGTISKRTQKRIEKLPLMKLEELAEALLDFDSAKKLIHWLDENEGK